MSHAPLTLDSIVQTEGLQHVLRMMGSLKTTPDLETPDYTILKSFKEYEIRKYAPFLVAETNMDGTTGPAGGAGFNTLAGYIFGGNEG